MTVATCLGAVAAPGATQVSGDWTIDIKTLTAILSIIVPGVAMGGWWTSCIINGQSEIKHQMEIVFQRLEEGKEARHTLENIVSSLPCQECNPPQHGPRKHATKH